MTEQELRSNFFAKTGRIATSDTGEYQVFLWGFQAGVASRDAEIAELVAALEQCNRYAKATLPTGYLALFTGQALAKVRKP